MSDSNSNHEEIFEPIAVLGHSDFVESLASSMSNGRMHHAWLLTGPSGIGKASVARAAAAWGTSDCSPLLSGDSGQQDHRSRFPHPSRRPPQIGWARRRAFQTTPTVAVPLRAVRVGFFLTREKSEARPRFSRSD